MTCTACEGKGKAVRRPGSVACPQCNGKGTDFDPELACSLCVGRGFVLPFVRGKKS